MRRVACAVIFSLVSLTAPGLGQAVAPFVLRCGNLFDGRSDSVRKNVFVLIEGEKIKSIAASAPGGAEVIDLRMRLACRD